MWTSLDSQSLEVSLKSHLLNETYLDGLSHIHSNTHDHPTNLFELIAIWTIFLITIVCGSIGNILVLYVYVNRKDNKTCTFFIKILAVVDLMICLLLAPLDLYQTTKGIGNEYLCKFYGFLSTHVLYSTFLITIIAFDRYFCICWPLYKIITLHRAHAIVIIFGLLSSLLAIIPMTEYSTFDHILKIHDNHSAALDLKPDDGSDTPTYKHVANIKSSASTLPFTVENRTDVNCSPRFSFELGLTVFIRSYRKFHSTLFAVCIILVLTLYAFIYNAVYQRRVTRTRKLSAYRRIIRSYLVANDSEHTETQSFKTDHYHHHYHHQLEYRPSTLSLICCYCCKANEEFNHELQRTSESTIHRPLNERQRQMHYRHMQDEPSSVVINHQNKNKPQIVLEVNGARYKRYSAVSMTSMTYLTSGVWDENSPTSLIRSRINSIAATTYCGTEHSSTSRPSTSTEDSFDQASRILALNNTLAQSRPTIQSNSAHLTVMKQARTTSLSPSINEVINKSNNGNENESTNLLHPSIVRKPSSALSSRPQQRTSDTLAQSRKVSFMTSTGIIDRCINEDFVNVSQRSSLAPPNSPPAINQAQQRQSAAYMNNERSLSTTSSIYQTNCSIRNLSIASARRPSTFDGETQRILERQQTQERLANIRTTFTLFIVTATFIIMYLPSIIQTLFDLKEHAFREVVFLLYYINSACNPLIYSFFNVNFRNDIRRIYECQRREYFARRQ